MLQLQEGQFVKLTGTIVKGENDIYVVAHDYTKKDARYSIVKNEYCLIKVKLDGTEKSGGYRYYFYNEKSIKNDPNMNIEIVTDLKKAKKEVNEYLNGINSEEVVIEFVKSENQEVKDGSIIKFPNGIKFGTFGEKYIGNRTIWLVKFRENKTIYIKELGKKGQTISSGNEYSCTIGLTQEIIKVCEVLNKIETKKGDIIKESKPVEVIEIVAEPETKETSAVESIQEITIESTEQTINNEIGCEVKFNTEKNGIELYFNDKPSEEIRNQLKANGYRWAKFNKCWYTKDSEQAKQFLQSIGLLNNEGQQENNTINTTELKEVEPIEINIDNINAENFLISKEISKRENDGHWVMRTKERDHQQEILNYLNNYQNKFIIELDKLEDNSIKNKYKSWLNSYKKRYYENYYKLLRNNADNPSWMTTGRDGRNARKDAKMNSRHDNLMRELIALESEYKSKLGDIKGKIIKEKDKKFIDAVLSNKKEYEYKRIKKQVNVSISNGNNYFQGSNLVEKTAYITIVNAQDYYILNIWGTFIAVDANGNSFKKGSCSTLKDAKIILNYYLSEIEKSEQVAV